jgi:hypothetical protein
LPPAALPGAFMPAGAPGLLKKFDQNFCLAVPRQEFSLNDQAISLRLLRVRYIVQYFQLFLQRYFEWAAILILIFYPRRHLQCGKKHEGTRRKNKKICVIGVICGFPFFIISWQ